MFMLYLLPFFVLFWLLKFSETILGESISNNKRKVCVFSLCYNIISHDVTIIIHLRFSDALFLEHLMLQI